MAAAGCAQDKQKVAACDDAWRARIAVVEAQTSALDKVAALDDKAADAAVKAAASKIDAIAIAHRDVDVYPDRVKPLVAKAKMRLASMSATHVDPPGQALRAVKYDFEIQGDYRALPKTLAALYAQPKAFFIDKVELNITDEYRKWCSLKGTVWVYQFDPPPPKTAPGGVLPDGFAAATADAAAPAECTGVRGDSSLPQKWQTERAALAARSEEAKGASAKRQHADDAGAWGKMAEDLVHRRDDNKALFLAHADELVNKTKASVAGVEDLKFNGKGEPEYDP